MVDPRDVTAQGDPETVMCLPDGDSLVGLSIRRSGFGSIVLGIREDQLGRPMTCAITHACRIKIAPHRYRDDADHHKGYVEDEDGA